MRIVISFCVLVFVLSTSATRQTPNKEVKYAFAKKPLYNGKELLKPNEELLRALKELEMKSNKCSKSLNKILKSQKDSLSLLAHK